MNLFWWWPGWPPMEDQPQPPPPTPAPAPTPPPPSPEGKPKMSTFARIKGYYKGLIAFTGSTLIILNTVSPVFNFLGSDARHWFNVVVAVATTAGVILKANEPFIEELPQ